MVVGRMDWVEARMKVQDQLQWRRQETLMAWTWWWPQSWRKADGTKSQIKCRTDTTWWQVDKCGEVWRKEKSQGWFLDFWFGKLVDARWCHVVRRQWLRGQKGYRDQKSRVLLWIYSFWGLLIGDSKQAIIEYLSGTWEKSQVSDVFWGSLAKRN